jgi:hypothetical protein
MDNVKDTIPSYNQISLTPGLFNFIRKDIRMNKKFPCKISFPSVNIFCVQFQPLLVFSSSKFDSKLYAHIFLVVSFSRTCGCHPSIGVQFTPPPSPFVLVPHLLLLCDSRESYFPLLLLPSSSYSFVLPSPMTVLCGADSVK